MLSPHESLVVSQERGVLAAVLGNPAFYPGIVDVYDISAGLPPPGAQVDRARPASSATRAAWRPTGKTFYSASPGSQTLVAVDISNPSAPVPLWIGPYDSHGLSISDDGNRAYVAGVDSGLIILDVSEIQARMPNPQVREIARLQWDSMSIPQNAIPVTIDGHPYVVEIDEFGTLDEVGAGRIIDIGDEAQPAGDLEPAPRGAPAGELRRDRPATRAPASPLQGYAGHYCNVPTRVDPGIVACSMILSGLRVFDIRDPRHPREIAYFNAPIGAAPDAGLRGQQLGDVEPLVRRPSAARSGTRTASRASSRSAPPTASGRSRSAWARRRRCRSSARAGRSADVIVGGRTRDRIKTRGGKDRVCAKGKRDRVNGGGGKDRLKGGGGRDSLRGGAGNDRIDGRLAAATGSTAAPGARTSAIAGRRRPRPRLRADSPRAARRSTR